MSLATSVHLWKIEREQEREIERDSFNDEIALVIHVLICIPTESTAEP